MTNILNTPFNARWTRTQQNAWREAWEQHQRRAAMKRYEEAAIRGDERELDRLAADMAELRCANGSPV